jgi:hypothetical protein
LIIGKVRGSQEPNKFEMKQKKNQFDSELYRVLKTLNVTKLNENDKMELLNFFVVTNNPLIWNHLALIFSDIKFDKAVPAIINKINDRKSSNDKGTLIYSLENLDCKEHFLSLIRFIGEMDYESRLMALGVVEKLQISVSNKIKKQAIELLDEYIAILEKSSNDNGENSSLHFVEKTKDLLVG